MMPSETDLVSSNRGGRARYRRVITGACRKVADLAHSSKLAIIRTFSGLPTIGVDEIAPDLANPVDPILERVCLPPYFGTSDHDDFTPLMRIASHCHPRVIVELGTAYGNTVANLCRQCPDARVYTVNAPAELQTGKIVTFELSQDEIGRVYRAHGFSHRVTQIFENTLNLDLSRLFSEPVVDLAIVDACHDTEYVVNDFYRIVPYMGADGIVLFHDTHPSMGGHLYGSYQACVRLRRAGFGIQHIRGT
jgi:predicted O-methyltransferase YrrM